VPVPHCKKAGQSNLRAGRKRPLDPASVLEWVTLGVVMGGEIVERVQNLLARIAFDKFEVRLAPQLEAAVVMWPVALAAPAGQPPFHALPAVLVPLAIRVLIIPGTLFAHGPVPQIVRRGLRHPSVPASICRTWGTASTHACAAASRIACTRHSRAKDTNHDRKRRGPGQARGTERQREFSVRSRVPEPTMGYLRV